MLERTQLRGDQMCLLNTVIREAEAAVARDDADMEDSEADSSDVSERAEQGVWSLINSSKAVAVSLDSALRQQFCSPSPEATHCPSRASLSSAPSSQALKAVKSVLTAHNVYGRRYYEAKHFDVMQIAYGSEKVQFINSFNYRNSGPRSDTVEIRVESETLAPARIIAFFRDEAGEELAIVQWFQIIAQQHPVMLQPRCRVPHAHDQSSYGVVSIEAISGHAHMVPDFDAPTGQSVFWWDVIF